MREFLVTKFVCAVCGGNLKLTYDVPKCAGQHANGEPTGAAMVQQLVAVEPCVPCLRPLEEMRNAARTLFAFNIADEPSLPVIDHGPESLEREIQAKASKAPRVTPADIEAEIASEHYFTAAQGASHHQAHNPRNFGDIGIPSLGLLTFCVLVLRNGFTVHGSSACASPENFDAEIGRRIAREKAVQEIWPLLGFRLRDELARPVLTEADAAADLAGVPRPARPA